MDILTVGDISKELKVDRDSVSYAIRKLNIEPVGRAGIVRLFPASTLFAVKEFVSNKSKKKQLSNENMKCR